MILINKNSPYAEALASQVFQWVAFECEQYVSEKGFSMAYFNYQDLGILYYELVATYKPKNYSIIDKNIQDALIPIMDESIKNGRNYEQFRAALLNEVIQNNSVEYDSYISLNTTTP